MNDLEKLITDLSNYWDLSPEKVVDRLNHMNESEIKNVVNKMTKKFQTGGFLSNGMPIGNRMIISKETTYKPRPVVSDEMIDSAMRAENKARAEQFQRNAAELESRLFQTQQELRDRRGSVQTPKTPFIAPETGPVGPKYYNGPRPKFEDGGIMKCLKGGKTYAECKKCNSGIIKNQNPAGPMNAQLPKYGKIVEQGWDKPRYTFMSDINGRDLSTVTPDNLHTYDGMTYAVEKVANPWGPWVNQMNKTAGLPMQQRMYQEPDFRHMIQQTDGRESFPIAESMSMIYPRWNQKRAVSELKEKQQKIRAPKKK